MATYYCSSDIVAYPNKNRYGYSSVSNTVNNANQFGIDG